MTRIKREKDEGRVKRKQDQNEETRMKRQDKTRQDKKSQDKTRTHQVLCAGRLFSCCVCCQDKPKPRQAEPRRDTRHGKGRKKNEKFKNCSDKYISRWRSQSSSSSWPDLRMVVLELDPRTRTGLAAPAENVFV